MSQVVIFYVGDVLGAVPRHSRHNGSSVHGWTVASGVFVTAAEESPGSMGRLPGNAWA
jgi:hypothetical protein